MKSLEQLILERNRLLTELSLQELNDPRRKMIVDPIKTEIKAVEEKIKLFK